MDFAYVALLRTRKLSGIDAEHVAEELKSMRKSERRELSNRLALLISHLLKWEFQLRLKKLLNENPSLKYELSEKISEAYS